MENFKSLEISCALSAVIAEEKVLIEDLLTLPAV